jgi:FtsH-binding integral membrane protein
MDIESLITLLDYTLNTRRKRHIVGGILMSIAALFGGLSLTAMTIRKDEKEEDI